MADRQIIAFLDTGAGKTFISVLLLRDVAAELSKHAAARKALTQHCSGGCARARPIVERCIRKQQLAIFLAPTVALVKQVRLIFV